jgi:hypothetical protein
VGQSGNSPECGKRREVLHWVEKRHDNNMADVVEKAERVVQQDIFRSFRRHHYVPGHILGCPIGRKGIHRERATLERGEKSGGWGRRMQEKGHHIMHV